MEIRCAHAAMFAATAGSGGHEPACRCRIGLDGCGVAQDETQAQAFLCGECEASRACQVEHPRMRRKLCDHGGEAAALEGLVHGPQHVFGLWHMKIDERRGVEARELQSRQIGAAGFGAGEVVLDIKRVGACLLGTGGDPEGEACRGPEILDGPWHYFVDRGPRDAAAERLIHSGQSRIHMNARAFCLAVKTNGLDCLDGLL